MSDTIQDLLSEKSLWDIWRRSFFATVGTKGFWINSVYLAVVFLLAFGFVVTWDAKVGEVIDLLKILVASGISYSITMLGFLLSGFAIMAGVTKPDLWLSMAQTKKPNTDLSYLKYNFFVYMRVFIYHILYLAVFMSAQLLLLPRTIFTKLVYQYSANPECVKMLLLKVGVVFFTVGMGHLLIQLKYFVFNVYHSIMTTLAWEYHRANAANIADSDSDARN